jgi:hypothetical protein
MKFAGDIPYQDRLRIEELETLEAWFRENGAGVPPLTAAKGMTCIAHDWYFLHLEEEGERLLKEAEKLYPGYFEYPIYVHMEKDKDFNKLVDSLKETLGLEMMKSLGFKG